MKDCDYKKCVRDILEYRKNYGLKENEKYISDYLFNKLIIFYWEDVLLSAYQVKPLCLNCHNLKFLHKLLYGFCFLK